MKGVYFPNNGLWNTYKLNNGHWKLWKYSVPIDENIQQAGISIDLLKNIICEQSNIETIEHIFMIAALLPVYGSISLPSLADLQFMLVLL